MNIADALGAEPLPSLQTLTLYIPERDRTGKKIRSQRRWVEEAAELLADIGGGVTIMPPVEGGWLDQDANRILWERPILLYTHVKADRFLEDLEDLREFLHRLGSRTRQGEIALEFDDEFYRIRDFDASETEDPT